MTLHEAIQKVLKESNRPLTGLEIAEIINKEGYYKRKDNEAISDVQIFSRVNSYSYLFDINNDREITLKSEDVFKDLVHHFSYTLLVESKEANLNYGDIVIALNSLVFVSLTPLQLKFSHELTDYFDNIFIYNAKQKLINLINDVCSRFYKKDYLINSIVQIIEKVNDENCYKLINIILTFWQINNSNLEYEEIGKFYNENINAFSKWNREIYHEYSTPPGVLTFLSKLIELEDQSVLFDPFAGFCSSLVKILESNRDKNLSVVAWDISEMCACLGTQNFIINQIQSFQFELQNSFDSKLNSLNADCIVTNPPIQSWNSVSIYDFLKGNEWLKSISGEVENISLDSLSAAIVIVLYHLSETGKAAIIVPNIFLSSNRKDYEILRQILIRANILKAVITLPLNIYKPYTALSFSILLIDKCKNDDHIYFLDNSNLGVSEFEVSIDNLVKSISSSQNIEDFSCSVSPENISQWFDLSPRTYLFEKIKGQNVVNLKDVLISCYAGLNIQKDFLNPQEGVPYIQISDLGDSDSINIIDLISVKSYITDPSLLKEQLKFIPKGSILVAKIGTKLKPTLFNTNLKAVCSANILIIVPNTSLINSDYLLSQLQSKYIQRQIDAVRKYIGPPNFSKSDLLKIRINIPSIEDQQKLVSEFYIKQASQEKNILEKRTEDELYNLISSLKHEIKQPISSIGLDIDSIKDFLAVKVKSQLPIIWEEPIVETLHGESKIDEFSLLKVVSRIESNVKEAQFLLAKAEETLNLNKGVFSPETFNVKDFLLNVIVPIYQNYNCSIHISGHPLNITADKYQICVLFKRIIENAIKHGFQNNRTKEENIINILLASRDPNNDFNQIIIENNGELLPEEFNINSLLMKGFTSNRYTGSGFGGYHIKRIIENHKGEFQIASKSETVGSYFQVKFKIFLPCQI
jgi:type I restriction enzyme M protein